MTDGPASMRVDVFTIFPSLVDGALGDSIVQRARTTGRLDLQVHDLRQWTHDRHRTVDDTPYGGGPGMVMKVGPIVDGVESVLVPGEPRPRILVTAAGGRLFDQALARDLAEEERLVIVCGHYEGIDDRVATVLGAEEISIGGYVLTGGELPAAVIVDAVTRLLPGVITAASIVEESHDGDLVEYPHFTRPAVYRGFAVPDVLRSGDHAAIARWRREQAIARTTRVRASMSPGQGGS